LAGDICIVFQTVGKVLRRSGISGENSATMEPFRGSLQEAEK